jgi:hypothetical protein
MEPEPEPLKTTFHVLWDHGWVLGSLLMCRTITFHVLNNRSKLW